MSFVRRRSLALVVRFWCGFALAIAGATSINDPQWALETFVDLTAANGDPIVAELRRHCCHGIAETTADFCDEFKIPPHDCVRLEQFMRQAPHKTTRCECPDSDDDVRMAFNRALKIDTATVRVVRTDTNRTEWLKLATHEGDLAVLDERVDQLCKRFDLDGPVCGNLRGLLRKRSIREELKYHMKNLLAHTTQPSVAEYVVAAFERMINATLVVNDRLREELDEKAVAFERLYLNEKKARHRLERRVRELENQLVLSSGHAHRPLMTSDPASTRTSRQDVSTVSTPTFASSSLRIPRVHASNLSYALYLRYAQSSIPVIIQGLADQPGSPGLPRWTLQTLKADCGDATVTLKRVVTEALQEKDQPAMMWAGIKPVANAPLRHFLRDFIAADPKMTWPYGYADLYLHDASIQAFCPQLLHDFTFPRYFTDDRLQLISNSKQGSYWPSLFVGGASTASALHVDWASTAAWMGLLAGRKHWAIAKPTAKAALFEIVPTDEARTRGRFNSTLLGGENSPLLRPGEVYEDVLEAGEVLFIPADCPHQVQNLEDTIAVAANFVDSANVDAFRREVKVGRDSTTGDQSRRHASMLLDLQVRANAASMADQAPEPVDLSYTQFKTQYGIPALQLSSFPFRLLERLHALDPGSFAEPLRTVRTHDTELSDVRDVVVLVVEEQHIFVLDPALLFNLRKVHTLVAWINGLVVHDALQTLLLVAVGVHRHVHEPHTRLGPLRFGRARRHGHFAHVFELLVCLEHAQHRVHRRKKVHLLAAAVGHGTSLGVLLERRAVQFVHLREPERKVEVKDHESRNVLPLALLQRVGGRR